MLPDPRRLGDDRLHPERPRRAVLRDRGQVLLGKGEAHVNRVDLVDHQQRVVGIGLDDVAGVDQEVSGAPVDGRADGAVVELEPGVLHRRLVGADGGLGVADRGLSRDDRCLGIVDGGFEMQNVTAQEYRQALCRR